MIGKHLSHYKITAELGRGGMGIVYRAQDTRLDRTVAIKVLPSASLASEDDRARFYREAKAAAALTHPHIAIIHAVDEAVPEDAPHGTEPSPFIAMEFIDGETVEERIKQGPLPLEEAVRIASEVASALKLAHENEIVHRDIKAANVMLAKDGSAKVLDFGLAQTAQSTKLTRLGSTLGTAAYMSPEQARGEVVDRRSDLWSLGVVLYEMITGRPPFSTEYEQAALYSILNEDPEPLTAVRTGVSLELERITAKCLSKAADSRYQSASDLIVDLENVDTMSSRLSRISSEDTPRGSYGGVQSDVQHRESTPTISRRLIAVMLALLFLAVGIAIGSVFLGGGSKPAATGHFSIAFPPGVGIGPFSPEHRFAFSPDGQYLAYQSGSVFDSRIYLRERDNTSVTAITPETDRAWNPFFSPDGTELGYYDSSSNTFKRIEIPDGSPQTIGPSNTACCTGVTWGPEGQIVYGIFNAGLFELSGDGSTTRQITVPDSSESERTHRLPRFVPGTNDLLFTVGKINDRSWDQASIAYYSGSSGTYKIILPGARDATYVSTGHVIYGRDGALFAAAFDLSSSSVTGTPARLGESVAMSKIYGRVDYSLDDSGTLAFIQGGELEDPTFLNLYSRNGDLIRTLDSTRVFQGASISPDGRRIVLAIASANDQVWIRDRASGQTNPFTVSGNNLAPVWSPDGSTITYSSSNLNGGILDEDVEKSSPPRLLVQRQALTLTRPQWSLDGAYLAYSNAKDGAARLLTFLKQADGTSLEYKIDGANLINPRFSPDGKWFAYASDELGDFELYVARFPEFTDRRRITTGGGTDPAWNRNGRELFYWDDMDLISVPVESDGRPGTSGKILFSLENEGVGIAAFDYDPRTDQFLVVLKKGEKPVERIDIMLNWFDVLKRAVEPTLR